jgi:GNAT superfamily N-acetyltransferase
MDHVELGPGDPRLITDALPVLQELRPHITAASFSEIYEQGFQQGLRFWAVYLRDRCVGVCGWRVIQNTSAGRKLYIDDLVTTEKSRGQGIGGYFLSELADRAREEGCSILDLDSGTHRTDAHRFYLREGMSNTAFHFGREIT